MDQGIASSTARHLSGIKRKRKPLGWRVLAPCVTSLHPETSRLEAKQLRMCLLSKQVEVLRQKSQVRSHPTCKYYRTPTPAPLHWWWFACCVAQVRFSLTGPASLSVSQPGPRGLPVVSPTGTSASRTPRTARSTPRPTSPSPRATSGGATISTFYPARVPVERLLAELESDYHNGGRTFIAIGLEGPGSVCHMPPPRN